MARQKIWGIDLGVSSVGFSVIELDEKKEEGRIIDLGARIFPQGVDEKGKTPNSTRRDKRLIRRQVRRRKLRRKELAEMLADMGLLPHWQAGDDNAWNKLFNEAQDPYALRAAALNRKLEPQELGRALYHLAKRRGFFFSVLDEEEAAEAETENTKKKKSQKDSEGEKESPEKVKDQIQALKKEMGDQTLGAYLNNLEEGARKRGRYTGRDQYEHEFEEIWKEQAAHYPDLLTADAKEKIQQIIFTQRPIFWKLKTLGQCALEPGERLCLKGSWAGQQFIMLQKLNSLKLAGGNERPLTPDERAAILALLMTHEKVSFAEMRKIIKELDNSLPRDAKFNFELGGETHIAGNAVEVRLAHIFGPAWPNHPRADEIREQIAQKRRKIDYTDPMQHPAGERIYIRNQSDRVKERAKFIADVKKEWGLSEEQAQALADIRIPSGWLRHSDRAVDKLNVHMERGLHYSEALDQEYPEWRKVGLGSDARLSSRQADMPDVRNPIVMRALNELRKVANNLIAVHGKPDLIRIELARSMKLVGKKREKHIKTTKENRKKRDDAAKFLSKNKIKVTKLNIEKHILWEECGHTCLFTGKEISCEDLFQRGLFHLEHIFPKSRFVGMGDSPAVKTLCFADFNIHIKRNQTPYECAQGQPEKFDWTAFTKRVKAAKLPPHKEKLLLAKDSRQVADEVKGELDLQDRLLTDTSYIAAEAARFLARLGVRVQTCNGNITSDLRQAWRFNHILNEVIEEEKKQMALAEDGTLGESPPPAPEDAPQDAAEAEQEDKDEEKDKKKDKSKKNRGDHRHHAVDALVVALATPARVKRLADYNKRKWEYDFLPGHGSNANKPYLPHPWPEIESHLRAKLPEIIVSHRANRKLSGALHREMNYGRTGEKDEKYEYFVRRVPLTGITKGQIKMIRDKRIRQIIEEQVEAAGGDPKKAFPPFPILSDKDGKKTEIKKVRIMIKRQPELMTQLHQQKGSYADILENHHIAVYKTADGKIYSETISLIKAIQLMKKEGRSNPVDKKGPRGGELVMSLCKGDMIELPNIKNNQPLYLRVDIIRESGAVALSLHYSANGDAYGMPRATEIVKRGGKKIIVDPIGRVRYARD